MPLAASLRAALCLCLLAAPAGAQDIKPRILLVFDTSGSMSFDVATGDDTLGDNSVEYPGNGGESRLAVAKRVITSIVETTSEVEFSLMRYPQQEGVDINNGNGRGQFTTYQGLNANPLNYIGFCDGTVRSEAANRPFSLVVPFGNDNEVELLSWLDNRESFPNDKELRAEGPTPIAESLRLSQIYFSEVIARDVALRCRQNYVILLTDGDESCIPRENNPQEVLLNRTLALRQLDVPVPGAPAVRKDVKVFVVAFGVSPAAVNRLNTVARAGGTAVAPNGDVDLIGGAAYTANDQAGLRRAFSRILADAIPQELCDGVDDDCDGRVDEGVLNSCGRCGATPLEVCDEQDNDCDGQTDEGARNTCGACGPVPVEVCDGRDNDCDGATDENVVTACGGCAAVRAEVCNALDDDCDGTIDNFPGTADPLARPCGGDVGECTAGRELCRAGDWGACDGVPPATEICDGLDNDCNGLTDEVTRPCGPALAIGDVGQCRVGQQACVFAACQADPGICDTEGFDPVCNGATGPSEEVCDGIDNDCDGQSDEGLFNACGRCGVDPPETCNGEDDNCDGRIDEDAACPRGYLCFVGECVQPCDTTGECPADLTCVAVYPGARFCHPDACAGAACPAGNVCDSEARTCVDPCQDVECGAGQGCDLGECVPATCRHTGCPDGQRCFGDTCQADPCAGRTCEAGEACRDGACVAACSGNACGPGRRCLDGACVDDPCGGRCLRTQRCDPTDGACVEDACARVTCAVGTACVDGACRADAPCVGITCPAGATCSAGACTDFTPGVPPDLSGQRPVGDGGLPPVRLDAAPEVDGDLADATLPLIDARIGADAITPPREEGEADDGCSCDLGGGQGPSLAWLLLLAAPALSRRRKRP